MVSIGQCIAGVVLATGLVIGGASASGADSHETSVPELDSGASPDSPSASAEAFPPEDPERYPTLDVPGVPWAYDTHYFFALTRGLEEAGVKSRVARSSAMVGTVVMDIVTLPGAALAGLYGT
jgi:hypothetical protein